MKKIIGLAAAVIMLTGCGVTTDSVPETTAEITAAVSISPEEKADSVPGTTAETTAAAGVSSEEKAEIQRQLLAAGKFDQDYLQCKEIIKHIDHDNFITAPKVSLNGNEFDFKWCLVKDGEVTSMAQLEERALSIFTEHAYLGFDWIATDYNEQDGKLYLSSDAGSNGTLLGYDYAYIASAEAPDGETVILNMTAFGAGENWDLDHDLTDNFTLRLKRTGEGLRIDSYDVHASQFIAWVYTPEMDLL